MSKSITRKEADALYAQLEKSHAAHLASSGVALPELKRGNSYTRGGIVLCALYKYFRQPVTKLELSRLVSQFFDAQVSDVQQARHLGKQEGWYIISGTRGQSAPSDLGFNLLPAAYCLISITEPYPGRASRGQHHREGLQSIDLDELRRAYDNRCASCGSKEGEPNLRDSSRITKLQRGHMDPAKALTPRNVIPQCDECNRAYRDWFVFDGNGRVIDINVVSDRWQPIYKKL
jgi:hypothetical protein